MYLVKGTQEGEPEIKATVTMREGCEQLSQRGRKGNETSLSVSLYNSCQCSFIQKNFFKDEKKILRWNTNRSK